MTDWILIACLVKLRQEFDALAPGRARASDGSIGDTVHQQEVSDHNPDETGSVPIHDADHINEVHAIDVDSDLRDPGLTMEDVVQFLLARCRSGAERRLRYVIYNRRIWEASNAWRERAYTGPSPHTEHAHFSASYETALEASTASWHLEDLMALTETDKQWISDQIAQGIKKGIDDACRLVPFDTGGGAGSQIGRTVLDSDYPAADGAPRTHNWVNQQTMQEGIGALLNAAHPEKT